MEPITVSDEEARFFLAKYKTYIGQCVKKYGSPQFFNELLSEGALAIIQAIQKFDSKAGNSLNNWIKRGVRNAIKNENRAQLRKRRFESSIGEVKIDIVAKSNFHIREEVNDILLKLTPKHRSILIDKFMKNMTLSEIARERNVSIAPIHMLLHAALRSCRYKYKVTI